MKYTKRLRESAGNVYTDTHTLTHIYDVCPDGIQPCNMKNRHLLKKI